jgi:hypothetical protein
MMTAQFDSMAEYVVSLEEFTGCFNAVKLDPMGVENRQ